MNKIAVVRVRGQVRVREDIAKTMELLGIGKKNHCTLVEATPMKLGMIKKAQNYITWGEVNKETEDLLQKKYKDKKTLPLQPPRKGYGRKGVKIPFAKGGALGYRGEKINDLIKRMATW